MRIGIIGAGNIGGTLTRRLSALGHEVVVSNSRGPQTLEDLAEETGATVALAAVAAEGAELVIVTIPERAIPLCPRASSTAPRPAPRSSTRATTTRSETGGSPRSRTA